MIENIAKLWRGATATCMFELRRSMSAQRISVTAGLALFPPAMLALLIVGAKVANADGGALMIDSAQFLAVFLIALVMLLGLLLWASLQSHCACWSFITTMKRSSPSNYGWR